MFWCFGCGDELVCGREEEWWKDDVGVGGGGCCGGGGDGSGSWSSSRIVLWFKEVIEAIVIGVGVVSTGGMKW